MKVRPTASEVNHNDEPQLKWRDIMTAKTNTMHRESTQPKVFTNFWLVTLAVIVGLTVLSTAVLIGWPIIAHLAARFMG